MSTCSEVMHGYEQIAPLTERMLLLARSRQWSDLPALEAQYSELLERVQRIAAEGAPALSDAQQARQQALLLRIRSNHAAVCSLVAPQLAQLAAVLRGLGWQSSTQSAYNQPGRALL